MKKFALITGASGGIGTAIAMSLAREGYSLYLHYNRNKKSIDKLCTDLKQFNGQYIPVQADLSTRTGYERLLEQLSDPVHSIIYNCGTSYYGLLTDMTQSEIESMIQLHVTSPMLIIKGCLQNMIQVRAGTIILISSIWGLTGASCEVAYSTVKGGQNALVKALAQEVAPSGVRVNAVAPGAIDTAMIGDFSPEDQQSISDDIPMGRFGKPQEVADAVSFLHSNKASYINGHILSVNGAWHC
jgi:3-oxoacyl-[acyl-carrier protein] reductase